MIVKLIKTLIIAACVIVGYASCSKGNSEKQENNNNSVQQNTLKKDTVVAEKTWLFAALVPEQVLLKNYVKFMDSIVHKYDSLVPYTLTEHIIVRNNPWIIDSLEKTDYYYLKEKGVFVYDQKELMILKPGDTLYIPTDTVAKVILAKQSQTLIDINIPEFKLRIIEGTDTLYTLPVRVGQNKKAYWSVDDKTMNLKTRIGKGKIVEVYFKKGSVDPQSGKQMITTKRDDGKKTLMPLSPWIEPEIRGERFGQLIHPTTNLETLGKAYSNGCIGTREGDIWRIYYYAPVGTPVELRYDVWVTDSSGKKIKLKDVYK